MKLIDLQVPLDRLLLDPNNYRLDYDSEDEEVPDERIEELQADTQRRLEKERLGELRDSIQENGFLEIDRIVVRRLKGNAEKFVVVEGNRRTAALKGLLKDYEAGILDLPEDTLVKAAGINVICIDASPDQIRNVSAALMGIRHVSGPKKWTGYQSARLISELVETGKRLTEVGSLLGISAHEAGRRLRGYRAYVQMLAHPYFGRFAKARHYTLLLEMLAPGKRGRSWLGWDDRDFLFKDEENLDRLYKAITTQGGGSPEIGNPQDARYFLACLDSPEHVALIESGVLLHDLPPLSDGDESRRLRDFLSYLQRDWSEKAPGDSDLLHQIHRRIDQILGDLERD